MMSSFKKQRGRQKGLRLNEARQSGVKSNRPTARPKDINVSWAVSTGGDWA